MISRILLTVLSVVFILGLWAFVSWKSPIPSEDWGAVQRGWWAYLILCVAGITFASSKGIFK